MGRSTEREAFSTRLWSSRESQSSSHVQDSFADFNSHALFTREDAQQCEKDLHKLNEMMETLANFIPGQDHEQHGGIYKLHFPLNQGLQRKLNTMVPYQRRHYHHCTQMRKSSHMSSI